MSTAFTRTLRKLDADTGRWGVCGVLAAAALAGAFGLWCTLTQVTLYEVAATARIEAGQAAYSVASSVAGRVTRSRLAIGREVSEGEILVELDSTAERLQIHEELTHQQALRTQAAALRDQVDAEENARSRERTTAGSGREETKAQSREADVAASHAEAEERRDYQLYSEKLLARRDYEQALAEARRLRAIADSKVFAVERTGQDQLTRESDRGARIQGLLTQIAALEAQIPASQAAIDRIQHEIDRRLVRAPMAGKLGDAAILRPGAVIKEGDKLGAVVPACELHAVAQFPADAAIGRIQPGQKSVIRLDGFPWIQYGTLSARVTRVANEIRDGAVRVEFSIDPSSAARIPLQHGLPGAVEVEVERITPWKLVMRHAGRQWSAPRETSASEEN